MASRLELHEELCNLIGSRNVYFQPPETIKLKYPCIIYRLQNYHIRHADNEIYNKIKTYSVTIIDKNPDTSYPDFLLEKFGKSRFDRFYTADNLNHYSFTLYY